MTLSSSEPCSLLSPPLSGVRAEVKYSRPSTETIGYQNLSDGFRLDSSGKSYNHQYYKVYNARLKIMKPLVVEEAKRRFGPDVNIRQLAELKSEDQEKRKEKILVIGTVFKQQENKPSILTELSEDAELEVTREPPPTVFTSESDTLVLEDETMRVRLSGEFLHPGDIVNGVVLGALGKEVVGGKFEVEDVVFARVAGPKREPGGGCEEDVSLCVMSGLELGGEETEWLVSAQLAADWLVGSAGSPGEQKDLANTERLIIAGDSLGAATRVKEDLDRAKYLTANTAAGSLAAVRQLDDLLVQIVGSLTTDLMPGPNDPATAMMPQQPLHRVALRQSGPYPSLACVTNPYTCCLAGRTITTVSGQSITDLLRNSRLKDSLEAMERCLEWAHLAPTAPDTLGCFPFTDTDPFVLHSFPDVFIAGNQPSYMARKTEVHGHSVLLVAVPKFSQSESIVRINLKNLRSRLISFKADMDCVDR